MENEFIKFAKSAVDLSDEEVAFFEKIMPVKTHKKGTVLLREGQVCKESYLCLKGLVRQYYLVDGEEKTSAFFMEGECVNSFTSYLEQVPSDHYLECIEETTLSSITYENELEMYRRFPRFEGMCRVHIEKDFGIQQKRLASYVTRSPEERYLDLIETRSDLINRVPQYQLASYLGVKPESLSRIRKRVSLKAS